MKTMKKAICMLLCLIMCLSVLSACGGQKDKEGEVTLTWVIPMAKQKDADEVQAAVNEELSKLMPNTKLEFVWEEGLASKWAMWMSAGTSYDLAWTGYSFDMLSECNNGSYTDLTELVEEYAPNIKAESKELTTAYNSAMLDGKLWAIPNEQPLIGNSNFVGIPLEFWSYFPVDEFLTECHANTKTTEKVYQLYEQYMVALTDAGLITPGSCSIDVTNFFQAVATRGYDWVGTTNGGAWLCYDAFDENAKMMNFMETDAYKLFIKYAARWAGMGYISADYLATGLPSGTSIGSGSTSEYWFGVDEERGVRYVKDGEGNTVSYRLLLDSEEQDFTGVNTFGSEATYTVIPYTSKNPERAIKLLDLLKTSEGEDLLNLIVYGIEGKHYTKKQSDDGDYVAYGSDYTIQPSSQSVYGIPHWMVCNVFECYRTPNILDGQKEWAMDYILNVDKNLHWTRYKGFTPDVSDYTYQISQVSAVISEYHSALICGGFGTDGYQEKYDAFMAKLKTAEIDKLIETVQTQADEYLKSK